MKSPIVRLEKIELVNFKNVENGNIEFKNNICECQDYIPTSEILGIYGQNGSGKTALVNACNFLKRILEGKPIESDAFNYINVSAKETTIKSTFYISNKNEEYMVNFEFTLKKVENEKVVISNEKLMYSKKVKENWLSRTTLMDYDVQDTDEIFLPKYRYASVVSNNKENIVNLKVAQRLAQDKNTSFIFSSEVKKIFASIKTEKDTYNILDILTYFAKYNFFVIMNNRNGVINLNSVMPLCFRLEEKEKVTSGDIAVELGGICIVTKSLLSILTQILVQMNIVLKYIVPNLQIELSNFGEQYDTNGNIGFKVQLLSVRENVRLPIEYESDGIKKIISILSALISMYNNPSICMVVDELDSGIYEFLLGEILKVIEKGGKGQLIFTSHNLRPLEVLNKNSLYFTTTNIKNRYIRFSNVKESNNLRSLYIRSINLGGQKEELYKETNSFEIQRAFRLAGEKLGTI